MSALARGTIAVMMLALLAACQEDGPTVADLPPGPDLMAALEAGCVRDGGRWGASTAGGFTCFRPTRDANRSCQSASDCEGLCLARSRTCSPIKPFLGCHEVLTDAGLPATLCVN